jgi:hypothetical protein
MIPALFSAMDRLTAVSGAPARSPARITDYPVCFEAVEPRSPRVSRMTLVR